MGRPKTTATNHVSAPVHLLSLNIPVRKSLPGPKNKVNPGTPKTIHKANLSSSDTSGLSVAYLDFSGPAHIIASHPAAPARAAPRDSRLPRTGRAAPRISTRPKTPSCRTPYRDPPGGTRRATPRIATRLVEHTAPQPVESRPTRWNTPRRTPCFDPPGGTRPAAPCIATHGGTPTILLHVGTPRGPVGRRRL